MKKIFKKLKTFLELLSTFQFVLIGQLLREKYWKKFGDHIQFELNDVSDLLDASENKIKSIEITQNFSVILTVYNGLSFLEILRAQLRNHEYELIIVDDCSTESKIKEFLQNWGMEPNTKIISNDSNIGYLKSVNLAISHVKHDFIILNSDTQVSGNWANILIQRLRNSEGFAAISPFSNSATIFSYPIPNVDNDVSYSIAQLQNAALINLSMDTPEAPTCNGFAMAIRYDAWEDIGTFNEIKFDHGYGEENDWCMRAKGRGWKVGLAPDVFVMHEHGGSFNEIHKEKLISQANRIIARDWPSYFSSVEMHCTTDPWRMLRDRIGLQLWSAEAFTLIFTHNLGGGIAKWANSNFLTENSLIIQPGPDGIFTAHFRFLNAHQNFKAQFATIRELYDWLQGNVKCSKIVMASLVGYPNPIEILQLFKSRPVPVNLPAHDYFAICPSLNLLDNNSKFCNVPVDLSICVRCLPNNKNVHDLNLRVTDIQAWRGEWNSSINSISYYSRTSEMLFRRAGFDSNERSFTYHETWNEIKQRSKERSKGKNVAFVGDFTFHKGAALFNEIARRFSQNHPEYNFFVIGRVHWKPYRNIIKTGAYQVKDLSKVLEDKDISLVLIPSIWPETYNYVFDELASVGVSCIVSPLGAMAERIRDNDLKNHQITENLTPLEFENKILEYFDE